MSLERAVEGFPTEVRRTTLNWVSIAMFAVALAYVDGFWVTSFQGAVGSFERAEPPFTRWLRDSTLMLPIFIIAMLTAVLLARRWVGQHQRTLVNVAATALLVVLISTALSIAEVAASSAWDYHLQTRELDAVHAVHDHDPAAAVAGSLDSDDSSGCVGVCAAKRSALNVHVKAVTLASVALVISNAVLVAWILALRSDRLWEFPSPASSGADNPRPGRVAGVGIAAMPTPAADRRNRSNVQMLRRPHRSLGAVGDAESLK